MKFTNLFMVGTTAMVFSGCAFFSTPAKNCNRQPCGCGDSCACETCPGKAVAATTPASTGVHPDSKNWTPLFNADLGNAQYDKSVWSMDANGVLTANKDDAIWTVRDYENFVLDFEYMYDPAANSGVIIYCSDLGNWIPNAVEIQILDDNDPKWQKDAPQNKNGGLYGHLAPKVNNGKPAGEWNRMTVTARGQHLTVAVNGEITVDDDLSKWTSAKTNPDGSSIPPWLSRPWAELATKGRIGFQGKHGSSGIYFRNLKIKEL